MTASIKRQIKEVQSDLDALAPQMRGLAKEIENLYRQWHKTDRESAKGSIRAEIDKIEIRRDALYQQNWDLLNTLEVLQEDLYDAQMEDRMYSQDRAWYNDPEW